MIFYVNFKSLSSLIKSAFVGVLTLQSSSSFLRLLPHLPVTSIPPFIFPSITRCKRQLIYLLILSLFWSSDSSVGVVTRTRPRRMSNTGPTAGISSHAADSKMSDGGPFQGV